MSNILEQINQATQNTQGFLNSPEGQTANQLWKQYGGGLPFVAWINSQVEKAKQNKIYKEGMSMAEIVKGNQQADINSDNSNNPPKKTENGFKIAGANGYLVIGAGIVVIAGLVYFGSKIFAKKTS